MAEPTRKPDEKRIRELREEYGLDSKAQGYSALASSGAEFAGILLVLVALGWWLDEQFGTKPWLLLGLAIVGSVGGLVRLIRRFNRAMRE